MKTIQYSNLSKKFRTFVRGVNFFTPTILDYIETENGIVELSTGKSFTGGNIYGVTVVKDDKHNNELSKFFNNKDLALDYMLKLK